MNKVFDFLDKYLMGPMGILSQKQFVRAIMAAGMATIPFTIVGSAFLILGILPQAFPFLEGVWAVSFDKINALYMLANRFTMGVLALYFNIVMGFELTQIKAQEYKLNLTPLNGALLGMMAFLMTMAELTIADGGVFTLKEGENYINGVLYGDFASRLGSSGIFVGILMATLAVFLYKECVRRNWTIKLPDVVPSGVSRSFTALIPCFVIAFVVLILNGLLICIGYDLFTIVSVPFGFVAGIADTWYGVFIINFLISALWSVGIHGANIISAFYSPITLANLDTNMKIMQGASGEYTTFAGEFQLNAAEQHIGGDYIAQRGVLDGLHRQQLPLQGVVDGVLHLHPVIGPQAKGKVPLGVKIHAEHPPPQTGQAHIFAMVVVFPTPPFWLETQRIFAISQDLPVLDL